MKLNDLSGILIVGAGHGIGLGIVKVLLDDYGAREIIATYRNEAKAKELLELASAYPERLKLIQLDPLENLTLLDKEDLKLRLLINACGFLHDDKFSPEKRLRSFEADYFLESMKVNALITPLLLKALEDKIPRDEEVMIATLGAKVGSIEDNKLGGWYSYRASKAALNMLIKTAAIEFKRTHKKLTLLSIHPGTTETDLSQPFLSGTPYKVHTPIESARNILKVLSVRNPEDSGGFYSWNGEKLPY